MAVSMSSMAAPIRKAVPRPGAVSSVGQTAAAPSPRGIPKKNTRDYGKVAPAPISPQPSPFGGAMGTSRLGGI